MPRAKTSAGNAFIWTITITSLILSSASLVSGIFQQENAIAVVDAVKLISQYKGIEEVKRTQQQRNQQLQANLDTLRAEFQNSLDEYEGGKATSGKKELALMEKVVQARQRNLISYEQAVNDQIKKQDEELANALLVKVNDYVKRYGERKGYAIILAAMQFGNVAYAKEHVDITDEVLEGLNREYKVGQ